MESNVLHDFDMSKYLRTQEDIKSYIQEVIEDGDASELAYARDVLLRVEAKDERKE